MKTITIHTYTATWDAAMNAKPKIKAGTLVRIHENSDAREFDSFRQHLFNNKMNIDEYKHSVGKFDIYKITENN